MRKMIRILYPLLFSLITLSCALFQSEIDTVTDLLPRNSDLSGWYRVKAPREYSSRIEKYNKLYKNSGIDKLSVCEFESDKSESSVIIVEIIRFDNVLNSYGFFSSRRGEGKFPAETDNEFYSDFFSLAQRGEYIVFAYTANNAEPVKSTLAAFIKISLQYIGDNYSKEPLTSKINILSDNNKYGIIYNSPGVETHEGIDRIYYTSWINDTKLVTVYASERNSFSDSYVILKNTIRKGYIVVAESDTEHTAFIREKDGTYSFISIYNNWIYGCRSVQDIKTGKIVIDKLKKRIISYIK